MPEGYLRQIAERQMPTKRQSLGASVFFFGLALAFVFYYLLKWLVL